ncbi:MAG: 5'-methylthioadenosine/adenosylhomocysteine nucleosidase [Trueperaceae bacterium]|nr:5'-methylthioadenosine/adenosylhomocysteine nucleosidase [Trueperaceae bacterium]
MIGIIGAMEEELAQLLERLEQAETLLRGPFRLHKGQLVKQSVMVAQCGISKVNAAALTQIMITEGVTKIIFTGVAGGLDERLKVGDIVISSDCMQFDVDVTALGYKLGEVPGEPLSWQADADLKALALEAAKVLPVQVIEGRIISGDQFIADPVRAKYLRETFRAACNEMEGAAVAQICAKWQRPFVIIRSISDTADHSAELDFRAFTVVAANRAKELVLAMLSLMDN